jgi:hypothetical protein
VDKRAQTIQAQSNPSKPGTKQLDRPLVPSWDKLKCIVTDLSIERTPSSGLLLGLSLALRFHLLAIDRLKEAFEYSVICHLEQAELGGELTDVAIDLF